MKTNVPALLAGIGVLLLATAPPLRAQDGDAEPAPCAAPGMEQFDFWVGSWEVTWEGGRGSNRVEKTLDGCVIVEHFDGRPGTALRGLSVSTLDRRTRRWRQTWVDNQAGYLDFVGGWEEDRMVLSRQAAGPEGDFQQRMVWYDITDTCLAWNWERSDDGGETWKILWQLEYARQTDAARSADTAP